MSEPTPTTMKLRFSERVRGYWSLTVTILILLALILVLTFSRTARTDLLDYDKA